MWPDEGQFHRADLATAARNRDPEAAHGRAYANLPPRIVTTEVKVGSRYRAT
jgi:hypothetical protein